MYSILVPLTLFAKLGYVASFILNEHVTDFLFLPSFWLYKTSKKWHDFSLSMITSLTPPVQRFHYAELLCLIMCSCFLCASRDVILCSAMTTFLLQNFTIKICGFYDSFNCNRGIVYEAKLCICVFILGIIEYCLMKSRTVAVLTWSEFDSAWYKKVYFCNGVCSMEICS